MMELLFSALKTFMIKEELKRVFLSKMLHLLHYGDNIRLWLYGFPIHYHRSPFIQAG